MNINLEYLGIKDCNNIYRNLPVSNLVEIAVERKEGVLCENGAFVVNTGKYTGRSPEDRFIVRQRDTEDKINWGKVNKSIDEEIFYKLYGEVMEYFKQKDIFIFDGFVGAMKQYTLPIRIVCEYAYQSLFAHQLFIRPSKEQLDKFNAEFTVIAAPGFKCKGKEDGVNSEAFVIINFDKKIILIGGTQYAGEIKKAVFTAMNFLLPEKGVFPMHASANIGENGDTAIFFGLSGTGKTTLSADPNRKLIGDDEHGWCENGIFNFEGGCYAKTIKLSRENEKEIYDAIRFGSVLENVILDEDKNPDYDDGRITENTRAAYPIHYIDNAELKGIGNIPKTVIFLTADAFGVMPPISKLTKEQAMYHFMSGYTSKLAGTERGITEPKATFSACFGEPFMPMNPSVYAELLGDKIEKYGTNVFLVNTGWLYGGYGNGDRIRLSYTRTMITAALEDKLDNVEFEEHPIFKILMPKECEGIPKEILNPENTWEDKKAYEKRAKELAYNFKENFKKFKDVPEEIIKAGPIV
ncbi:phosphoenolpyruvate carboxykinase (ATP) [Clostridium tetanomorphum]|uniref:Phosphoenolpyruvate carboxykinase (ATP) n=1 Tax=Clostridium tetanomorphum TaxID=1553 RepID=A0A923J0W6_CLOTT|nr:phosphoenolpyruvate carboxykinase (ATP) [Clostridium tetanomorphum]KAJ50898.1 phosphoenolpyruvate carboxykinase [Clostridium tetanomorphum DSM 665]MBC2397150.1 phosphoenolpyruvate carboxykinase (ATP) [Clostridium tetanomorphum]MBP1863072.1 phosphoenolpyruvate carboxykinase (ATP) [Clostridium tetanomorphum]NRS82901.1 phosphoenolpyruvate carboxykinase (ATP) [Clostridium tetanomorphum]NRZ99003.1 phosphoenolpyruvate carboxykinase (ATP) [Clostridium tetanomorphum]